jgi:predicted phage terminase large subunit-like protein
MLHEAQQRLLRDSRRFNVACMGRRFGKSTMGLVVSFYGAPHQPHSLRSGADVGWFAPTYKLLDEAWRGARSFLRPLIKRQDAQQHRLELTTNAALDFWSLDNPDSGRGRKYGIVIVDEAAMARNLEEAWTQAIRPTLADRQGGAWFLSTPKGGNYFKNLFERAADDLDWARAQCPTNHNPYIHPDEIEAMRRELPSLVFRQEVEAQFVDFSGAAVRREWLRYAEPPPGLSVTLGVDLALSTKQDADYTAIVAVSRDANGIIYVRDAQRIRAPFHQVLQFIQSMAAKWKPALIAIEQVQYQAAVVQELTRTTALPIKGVKPDKDKLTRFLPLIARYEQGLVVHAPGLPGWFEDELLSFPAGEHDDAADALAYAASETQVATYYPAVLRANPRAHHEHF